MSGLAAPLAVSYPWLLAAALCFALAAARAPRRRDLAGLVALCAATFALRALWGPARFFHQNGHAPEWVARAVAAVTEGYGPGFSELFHGAVARSPRDPEAAVFAVQSLLAALAPACAWAIARAAGARGALPWALALAVAADPLLARLARSESYLGVGVSLTFLAGACLAQAGVASWRRPAFLCAALGAGAIVAQAARVHPWLWAPAATVPVVLLVARGSVRRRLTAAALAALVVAAVVLLTSGRVLWDAAHHNVASRLSGTLAWAAPRRLQGVLVPAAPALVALVWFARRRRSAALAAAAAGLTLALFAAADLPAATGLRPWIHGAYARLYLPAAVALVAWLLRDVGATPARRWAAAVGGAALLLAPAVMRFGAERTLPTDAREQALARGWRASLPPDAAITWLAEADAGVLRLPLYPWAVAHGPRVFPADPARLTAPQAGEMRAGYYYRSSLCATAAGRAACEGFEGAHRLTPLRTWALPAVPSYFFPYVTPTVRVGLYRVEDAR